MLLLQPPRFVLRAFGFRRAQSKRGKIGGTALLCTRERKVSKGTQAAAVLKPESGIPGLGMNLGIPLLISASQSAVTTNLGSD